MSQRWFRFLRPEGFGRHHLVKTINGWQFSWQVVSTWWTLNMLLNCLPLILSISPYFISFLHVFHGYFPVAWLLVVGYWHMYWHNPIKITIRACFRIENTREHVTVHWQLSIMSKMLYKWGRGLSTSTFIYKSQHFDLNHLYNRCAPQAVKKWF